MREQADIERALEGLPAGTEVTVGLDDGSEVQATVNADSDGLTTIPSGDADAAAPPIDINDVNGIYLEGSTDGPE